MDLGDPGLYQGPDRYARWHRYAADDAVVWSEPGNSPSGFWSVFSHRACAQVLSPQAPFTSQYGMLIGFDAEHPDRAGGRMIVATDGARHARLRHILARFLSASAVSALQPFVAREVDRLLSEARESAVIDVARHVGPRLPAAVVCELLSLPPSDREYLTGLTDAAFASPDSDSAAASSAQAHTEIFCYFQELIAERRDGDDGDLIHALLHGDGMTPDDALVNCYNLLIGGNQTTRHVVAGCFHAASQAPDLVTALRANPAGVATAVEEVIRWVSPGMHVLRVATDDLTLGAQAISTGEPVVAWLAAANRDARVFEQPDDFLAGRSPNRHLGFGHGTHLCLGARLARLEAATLLHTLTRRADSVSLVGEPAATRSNLIQGYRSLRVEIGWRD
jgi:hydroxylation protein CepL